MQKYRGNQLMRTGFIGAVLIILVITIGLQPERLVSWATSLRYQALFTEAGGVAVGNDVTVSGIKVGSVTSVELVNGDALVGFTIDGKYALGSDTTAHIRTGTLLGERVLALESAGSGKLDRSKPIPTSRTSSPYSLTDAVSELTANTTDTDIDSINESLDTLAATLDQIAPQLGPTFDGLSRMSKALNSRNESLAELLRAASDVTGIFAERSEKVNALILNANDLVAVLNERRYAITSLLEATSAVSQELTQVVADNEAELAPALDHLNTVTAMLEKNRDNLAKMLPGAAKYYLTQGEIVANGAYYNALVPNLVFGQLLQPFLDYAFGFRRGMDAGQPPDQAGPRAELPFPVNGIPQPGDLPDDGNP
ncbi:virulence factor Mce family protein [Mycolicibacterium phlei]|jgi:phospholipid/cholesterol/gamma-HCH transport system substrate-binding protein|uniref:Mammalian cell entry protein n=2 Tax=Mycolicibacterium TaxID=1866885 RepID=A0A5N5UPA7_MYCPH|nr:MCE family protein [Mycolicibacterium phlei]VEG10610.1 virulence factor Mce family protein [Mycobacteroides chelonae]AMO62509.1 mce related protein [Mycolicibacterium phlei]EID10441.1 virulence factor Mce family protein [Mycolicibacterium phlei RIVM601174]KAB7750947.1 mammalian cell entry protein [Mycolicibacterium phlei DSM 43239 = CCUG 21000]KXW61577.1 mammalian cell entry protein [Mycolicibacterium phlei DSM 43239 = CCUG 21000]